MTKHQPPAKTAIADPILLKHAMEEFGVGRKWILNRVKTGAIRAETIDTYVVLEYADVKRAAPSPEKRDLLARARRRGKK